ncbi:MAG: hypothetical protein NVSMB47_18640 [Polyangiales bacterium]
MTTRAWWLLPLSGLLACGGGSSADGPVVDDASRDGATGGSDTGVRDASGGPTVDSGARADSTPAADSGAPPGDAPAGDVTPTAMPIKHVIVIVKENHTFDNYFGSFPGAEGITSITLKSGATITPPHAPDRTSRDLCHMHSCGLTDWNGGAMNGWEDVSGSDSGGDKLAWAQYGESDIPNYWAYAKTFTLADHFFSNALAPSWPGHMFLLAAQAGWSTGNPGTNFTHPYWGCDQSASTTVDTLKDGTCTTEAVFPCFKIPSLPDVLPAGTTWKFYGTNFYVLPEIWSMFNGIDGVRNGPGWSNVVSVNEFAKDVKNHTLPDVTWLVNQDLNDEHPNIGGICAGENWTVGYINQIMESDYWKDTAILFTMDDFGGWYDHVPPPRQYGCDAANPYGLGFRLPLIVISPYAKAHTVYKDVAEQASVPRFIEKVFGATKTLHSLDPAAQDEGANDLMGMFDFTQPPIPPLVLSTRTCL